jgi:hypothetical protein
LNQNSNSAIDYVVSIFTKLESAPRRDNRQRDPVGERAAKRVRVITQC